MGGLYVYDKIRRNNNFLENLKREKENGKFWGKFFLKLRNEYWSIKEDGRLGY